MDWSTLAIAAGAFVAAGILAVWVRHKRAVEAERRRQAELAAVRRFKRDMSRLVGEHEEPEPEPGEAAPADEPAAEEPVAERRGEDRPEPERGGTTPPPRPPKGRPRSPRTRPRRRQEP